MKFIILFLAISAGLALGFSVSAQEKSPKTAQEQKKKEQKLREELDNAYRKTLEELQGVITEEELAAFKRLSTNEERERMIETIWGLRDPTPETIENEFREEHYRRIAYANERFSSGIAGWKTDRGRIYIIWGPPDEIESHPAGGPYNRSYDEGGGTTSVHPFERWRYRHLEGLGTDVTLEFVDTSGSGEYHLTMDSSEKDALKHVPGAGPTQAELDGTMTRAQRLLQGPNPGRGDIFDKLQIYVGAFKAPQPKNRELAQLVTADIVREQIHLQHRFDFFRASSNSVLVPITLLVPNREVMFQNVSGVHAATLILYARITTLGGRVVQVFEDTIRRDVPETLLRESVRGSSVYQKAVPLAPGLYKLSVVIKDANSGNVGTLSAQLAVPRFEEDRLASSSLVLADQMERLPAGRIGLGQFVLGASKVRPRLDSVFNTSETLGVYLQIYNLQMDPGTKKPFVTVEYCIRKGSQELVRQSEGAAELGAHGEQLTIEKRLDLAGMAPGVYTLEVSVTDRVAKSTITPSAKFTLNASDRVVERRGALTFH